MNGCADSPILANDHSLLRSHGDYFTSKWHRRESEAGRYPSHLDNSVVSISGLISTPSMGLNDRPRVSNNVACMTSGPRCAEATGKCKSLTIV